MKYKKKNGITENVNLIYILIIEECDTYLFHSTRTRSRFGQKKYIYIWNQIIVMSKWQIPNKSQLKSEQSALHSPSTCSAFIIFSARKYMQMVRMCLSVCSLKFPILFKTKAVPPFKERIVRLIPTQRENNSKDEKMS